MLITFRPLTEVGSIVTSVPRERVRTMQSMRALSQNAARQKDSARGSPRDARGLRQDNDDTPWARQRRHALGKTTHPFAGDSLCNSATPSSSRTRRSDRGRLRRGAAGCEICGVLRLRGTPVSLRRALQIHKKEARLQRRIRVPPLPFLRLAQAAQIETMLSEAL